MARLSRILVNKTRWLDEYAERVLMFGLYAFIAAMVGGEAIWRYVAGVQTQWGGTAAIHAFIFLSWLGCAYHVRRRSHIRFDAIRNRLSPTGRFLCYITDDLLWLILAFIVIRYSLGLVEMHWSLGGTLEGTNYFPYWIAVAVVPIGWLFIAMRAVQDLVLVVKEYRRGEFANR